MKFMSLVMALLTIGSVSFAQTYTRSVTAKLNQVACFSVFEGRSTTRVFGTKLVPTDKLKLEVEYKDLSGKLQKDIVTVTSADYVTTDSSEALIVEAMSGFAVVNLYIDLYDSSAELTVNNVRQDYLKLDCQFELN